MAKATTEESKFPWKTLDKDPKGWVQRTFLLYGPSGVGKTRLASQFPKALLLSCDPGATGGSASAVEGIKQMKITSYDHLMSIIPILQQEAGGEFDTIIVDSITYLGKLSMAHILKSAGREMPRFDEFNLNYQRVSRIINTISEMDAHIVFTAIDKIDKDEITGKLFGGPDLVGKLSKELPQAVDVVCKLYTTSGYDDKGKLSIKYRFKSIPDDMWIGKDRLNILPPEGDSDIKLFQSFFASPA